MVETSCDLYITVQSEDLANVIEKHAIHEKYDGRLEYFDDFSTYRFYVNDFDRNDLYDAVPVSDWFLAASIVKWINEIIADIPAEARNDFYNCLHHATFIEMVVNVRWCEAGDDDESFRGIMRDGKYRFSKKKRSEYLPSPPPPLSNSAALAGVSAPYYMSEDLIAALSHVSKGERALALDTFQFSKRLASSWFMLFGLKSDGTVLSMKRFDNGEDNTNTKKWKDIIMLATMFDLVFGLKANGTIISAGVANWNEIAQQKWTGITSLLSTNRHLLGVKKDGSCVALGAKEYGHNRLCDIELSDGWHDVVSITTIGDGLYGLRKDGTVVGACCEDKYVRKWTNIRSLYAADGEVLVGLTKSGDVVTLGLLKGALNEVAQWHEIVSLNPNSSSTYGVKSDGTVIFAGTIRDCYEQTKNWTDIISLATSTGYELVGLKKDGALIVAGVEKKCDKNMLAHLKNVVSFYFYDNTQIIALTANGTVCKADIVFGKTSSILNSWKLW